LRQKLSIYGYIRCIEDFHKKGHNSGTTGQSLTEIMPCKSTLNMDNVNVNHLVDLKKLGETD